MFDEEPKPCKHPKYNHEIKLVYKLTKVQGSVGNGEKQLVAILKITCNECGTPYLFVGEEGWSTNNPTTSPTQNELRIPLVAPEPFVEKKIVGPN